MPNNPQNPGQGGQNPKPQDDDRQGGGSQKPGQGGQQGGGSGSQQGDDKR